jgi:hypothetical protein
LEEGAGPAASAALDPAAVGAVTVRAVVSAGGPTSGKGTTGSVPTIATASVKRVQVGAVPDRGGRVGEGRPGGVGPAWSARKAGGGWGGGGGGGVGKGGGGWGKKRHKKK